MNAASFSLILILFFCRPFVAYHYLATVEHEILLHLPITFGLLLPRFCKETSFGPHKFFPHCCPMSGNYAWFINFYLWVFFEMAFDCLHFEEMPYLGVERVISLCKGRQGIGLGPFR